MKHILQKHILQKHMSRFRNRWLIDQLKPCSLRQTTLKLKGSFNLPQERWST